MSGLKSSAGRMMAGVNRQCRFETTLFLVGHMRCGSTALSAIVCSRDDYSGYGEAHVGYRGPGDLGILAINQWRRGEWNRSARGLFDKILHNRYDRDVPAAFFQARAIFMARAPVPSIASIQRLFATIGSGEYATIEQSAAYYCERVGAMLAQWRRFATERRVGLTYEDLVADPDASLARISRHLGIVPELTNSYSIKAASQVRGAGDPLTAPLHDRIQSMPATTAAPTEAGLPTMVRAAALFAEFRELAAKAE